MNQLKDHIQQTRKKALEAFSAATTLEQLEAARIHYLGRNGVIADITNQFKSLSADIKRTIGPALQELKNSAQEVHDNKLAELKKSSYASEYQFFDVSAYKDNPLHGTLHVYTQVIEQLNTIFSTMGFAIVDGPEVEKEFYNFDALNIPEDHPARDMFDTFWLHDPGTLLRTHTSPVQIRAIESNQPPLAIFAPGRVYRHEETDASHDFMFMQAEALLIDTHVSMANLLSVARSFLQSFFGSREITIRMRPGYFPFVEPGVEIDASCPFCTEGCSICKHTRWIELLGAGLVHPNVLHSCGIDPEKYQGFAMGFGIDRLAMIKYNIKDIRLFHCSKISFLNQF